MRTTTKLLTTTETTRRAPRPYSASPWARMVSCLLAAVMFWYFDASPLLDPHLGGLFAQSPPPARLKPAPEAKKAERLALDDALVDLRDAVEAARRGGDAGKNALRERIPGLKARLDLEAAKVERRLAEDAAWMAAKELPEAARKRHEALARDFRAKRDALLAKLERVQREQQPDLDGLASFLAEHTPRALRTALSPETLGHRTLKRAVGNAPRLTFDSGLGGGSDAESDGRGAAEPIGIASEPADLAETVDVRFTPAITALAGELGRDPLRIFNWVRSHVDFLPTWGSIQGADLCLATRRGNACDTASLLIALLRVSGVPARYRIGTIEVPAADFLNWAGDFTSLEAAASLFASAGVPCVVRRGVGGAAASVRIEHVWVEAYVDYLPSRGAVHRRGDTWIELDPSFKRYETLEPLDLEAAVPSGIEAFLDDVVEDASVDPDTGSIAQVDLARVDAFLRQMLDQREAHLRATMPEVTVGELIGQRAIAAAELPFLPATLPHRVLARGPASTSLPEALRHHLTIEAGDTFHPDGVFRFRTSLPEVAAASVLLLYSASSPEDESLLLDLAASLRPIPSSLQLRPRLHVGGAVRAEGPPMPAGTPLSLRITFEAPTVATPSVSNVVHAGEALALGLNLAGVPRTAVDALRSKAQALEAAARSPGATVLGADAAEALLATNILSWFALVDRATEISSRQGGVVTIRYPSAGIFQLRNEVATVFGAPFASIPRGFAMDIDRDIVVSLAGDGDAEKAADILYALGVLGSTLEAELPLTLLSTPSTPLTGVSTIHALRLANEQGIPIHRVDAGNASRVLGRLRHGSQELREIQDAVSAGLEVIVPESPPEFNGRGVLATVVRDPATGSSSFLLGARNGSEQEPPPGAGQESEAWVWISLALFTVAAIAALWLAPWIVAFGAIVAFVTFVAILFTEGPEAHLFDLSLCEFVYLAIAAALTVLGFVLSKDAAAAGALVGFVIGVLGMEHCAPGP